MNEIFEKIYNDNNTDLNESSALFEKVYTEAEMLNEMNPKLRALLAAGLIGTASLGAASCSMPTDDPTIYEQPAEEKFQRLQNEFNRLLNQAHVEESVIAKMANTADIEELRGFDLSNAKGGVLGINNIFVYTDSGFIDDITDYPSNVIAYEIWDNDECYVIPNNDVSKETFNQLIKVYKDYKSAQYSF